jgi:hypothetical protein
MAVDRHQNERVHVVPVGERYIQAAMRSVSLEASVVDPARDYPDCSKLAANAMATATQHQSSCNGNASQRAGPVESSKNQSYRQVKRKCQNVRANGCGLCGTATTWSPTAATASKAGPASGRAYRARREGGRREGDFGNLAASLSILGDPVRVDGESRRGRLHRKGGEGRWESWW